MHSYSFILRNPNAQIDECVGKVTHALIPLYHIPNQPLKVREVTDQ